MFSALASYMSSYTAPTTYTPLETTTPSTREQIQDSSRESTNQWHQEMRELIANSQGRASVNETKTETTCALASRVKKAS